MLVRYKVNLRLNADTVKTYDFESGLQVENILSAFLTHIQVKVLGNTEISLMYMADGYVKETEKDGCIILPLFVCETNTMEAVSIVDLVEKFDDIYTYLMENTSSNPDTDMMATWLDMPEITSVYPDIVDLPTLLKNKSAMALLSNKINEIGEAFKDKKIAGNKDKISELYKKKEDISGKALSEEEKQRYEEVIELRLKPTLLPFMINRRNIFDRDANGPVVRVYLFTSNGDRIYWHNLGVKLNQQFSEPNTIH